MNDKPTKLELWYPIKPMFITQVWGILNLAYERFGFTRHNGVDVSLPKSNKLIAPVRLRIYDQLDFPQGGGYQVNAITTEKWIVPHLDDRECQIVFAFAHNECFLHKVDDILEVGDEIAVPDNTGFSTGLHTHIGAYRVIDGQFVDAGKNDANGSFNWLLYCNGFYAEDKNFVLTTYKKIIELATQALSLLKGRKT